MKRAAVRWVAGIFLLLAGTSVGAQQQREDQAAELLDAMLASFLGMKEATAGDLRRDVEAIGGIPFRNEVELSFIDRKEMARYLREVFDEEYPPVQARADARLLTALDLLPASLELRALRARILEENIAGFYDERPGRKHLFAVSTNHSLTPLNQIILVHEMRHALQDQYVDIHGALATDVGDFDDRRLALMSLLEGDATLVMERFLRKQVPEGLPMDLGDGSMGLPEIPGAPPVIRDQLAGPYFAGRAFVDAVVRQEGWDAIRRAWSAPPASMEQVLHPEKYLGRELPRSVSLAWSPPEGHILAKGVLGEFLLRTLLGEGSDDAAAGWGGDSYRVFDVGGRTLLLWRSVWDSAGDESQFKEALLTRYARSHGPAKDLLGYRVYERDSSRVAVRGDARGILLIASDNAGLLVRALRGMRE